MNIDWRDKGFDRHTESIHGDPALTALDLPGGVKIAGQTAPAVPPERLSTTLAVNAPNGGKAKA